MSIEYIKSFGITSLYHFTLKDNIDSICEIGLQSYSKLLELDINCKSGGNELSRDLDFEKLNKYIHLSFVKDSPMYHVKKNKCKKEGKILCWIEVCISILSREGILFCDEVANKKGAELFGIDSISKINFDAIKALSYSDARKEARKAEILVPNSIDKKYIENISCGN